MKQICIIGTKAKEASELHLYETGKKMAELFYVPITNLALLNNGEGPTVKYHATKLSKFDAVLFRVPKSSYALAYHVIKNLGENVVKMQSARSFLVASSKLSLFHELAAKGIKVPRTMFSEDVDTIEANLKSLNFPILIKVPTDKNKFMLATSEQEAKSMVDTLKTLDQPLLLEEYYPENHLFKLFVINNEVYCALKVDKPELNYADGESKVGRPPQKIIDAAIAAAKALRTEVAVVNIIDTEEPIVVDMSVCPYFEEAEKVSGKNLSKIVIQRLLKQIDISEHRGPLSRIMNELKLSFK